MSASCDGLLPRSSRSGRPSMSNWSTLGAGTTRCFVLEKTSQCGCHGEPWVRSRWNVNIDGYGSWGRVYHSRYPCQWWKAAQAKAIHGPGAWCRGSQARLPRSSLSLISRERHEASRSSWTRCSRFMSPDHRTAVEASPSWAGTTKSGLPSACSAPDLG